jgi:signal peptidase I
VRGGRRRTLIGTVRFATRFTRASSRRADVRVFDDACVFPALAFTCRPSLIPSVDPTTPMSNENAADRSEPQPVRRKWRPLRVLVDWLRTVSLALVLFVLVRSLFVEAFKIPSGSMEGTLLVGDFLLVNKLVYGAELPLTHKRFPGLRSPQRGDVIVFSYPVNPSTNFVKRVVGIAGDTLEMREGILFRNGGRVHEPYVRRTSPNTDPSGEEFRWQRDYLVSTAQASERVYHPSRNNWGPLEVPARHLFVLGDNRDNSLDSRYWGFVADSLVRGQPMVVYYSYARDSVSSFGWLTHVRWQRLFTRIE